MSRFFASNYEYESGTSSEEEDLLSSSSEEELLLGSSSGEESDDSFFNESEEAAQESDYETDDSEGKPYGPDWFKKSEFRKAGPSGGAGNKFLKGSNYPGSSDEDLSDDEGRKVVKSAKEKLLDEMQAVYDNIETAEMSEDWVSILNEFDTITRLLVRAHQQNMGTPSLFIKVVAQVEDLVSSSDLNEIKNKAVARAFNTIKQRARKVARENEDLLNKFREDPEAFEKETTVDLESSLDTGMFGAPKPATLASIASATSEVSFFTTLRIVMDSRGKKNVNQQDLLRTLEELLVMAKNPFESIMAYLTLIPLRFDVSSTLSYQPIEQWKASYNDIISLMNILDENRTTYQVSELAIPTDSIEDEPTADSNGVKKILGSLFSFVERLDEEFKKSLLNIDPHSSDYLFRLKDEQSIYNLILRSQLYLEATLPQDEQEKLLARPFIKRLDHIYYKSEKLITKMESSAWKSVSASHYSSNFIAQPETIDNEYITKLVTTLSQVLSKNTDGALRKRAALYNIYYHALNIDFYQAKDMLLSTNVQANINTSDPSLQILFNRVVVQLGLSAFKACLIEECHQVLNELLSASHLREILGQQTLQRVTSTGDDREKQCLPYHQHINLDLIDVVFMTCSLLIEIPQMTAFYSGIKVKRIPYSQKSIRRALEYYDKASFQGPPETSRDYILFAAKAMQKGDWQKSVAYLKDIKAWNLLPNVDTVLENLTERVQVESLKTYFFTYKRFYSSFSVKKLADLFNLPEDKIIMVLDTTISNLDINAKFNEDKTILVIEKGDEITKLEEVALKLNKEVKIVKERLNPSNNHR
ncbi:translation initiation factor eIF3 core subunit c NDAI_0I02580 [Naumovozyma dairenensis CBS 421]|uniref:Eukaryotic translation initiation factor 3 subunit C n=1 Tax=Naumovozyma dairenensis (strain ATCC 10597 / BCRC 20456 / CBS 421 / NBRC 0211 / NRRL Y-12639) TaxID=1071378 RepID=G0WGB5_NAUDC|nr:hypothetical protein NDAI_0I02580 [Naumovozyma dairenensis CBS 421]CCD26826.1 hypothetical protein NDAI_0I02580 [Naumovozyma dairenensis CBS 421]